MACFATSNSGASRGPPGFPTPETYCTRLTGRQLRKVAD